MHSKRAIEQLLALVSADPNDMRTRLKLGDLYARTNEHAKALEMYEAVGKLYADQGFMLKAIAVYKQMCTMVERDAPLLRRRYAHVPLILAELFQRLGLDRDAVAALDALGPYLSNGRYGPS